MTVNPPLAPAPAPVQLPALLDDATSIGINPPPTPTGQYGRPDGLSTPIPAGLIASDKGDLVYSIPLETIPSPRGKTPKLQLEYSSGTRGAPELAVGWSISGLPKIHRCDLTFATQGEVRGVRAEETDSLCLDGAPLQLLSGNYGEPGSLYATLPESVTRVEAVGGRWTPGTALPHTGPDHFVVHTPDGGRMVFGGPSSTLRTAGVAYEWFIVSSSDRYGNSARYTYDTDVVASTVQGLDAGEVLYLDMIEYGYNDNNPSIAPRGRIQFEYDSTRPDPAEVVRTGSRFVYQKRLARIDVFDGVSSAKAWYYRLSYESSADTGRSLLATVERCTSSSSFGEECARTKRFGYSSIDHFLSPVDLPIAPELFSNTRKILADLNGDGRTDIVLPPTNERHLFVPWAPPLPWPPQVPPNHWSFALAPDYQLVTTTIEYAHVPFVYRGEEVKSAFGVAYDINHDGRMEVLLADVSASWKYLEYTGTTLELRDALVPRNFAQDIPTEEYVDELNNAVVRPWEDMYIADFDGNGTMDILAREIEIERMPFDFVNLIPEYGCLQRPLSWRTGNTTAPWDSCASHWVVVFNSGSGLSHSVHLAELDGLSQWLNQDLFIIDLDGDGAKELLYPRDVDRPGAYPETSLQPDDNPRAITWHALDIAPNGTTSQRTVEGLDELVPAAVTFGPYDDWTNITIDLIVGAQDYPGLAYRDGEYRVPNTARAMVIDQNGDGLEDLVQFRRASGDPAPDDFSTSVTEMNVFISSHGVSHGLPNHRFSRVAIDQSNLSVAGCGACNATESWRPTAVDWNEDGIDDILLQAVNSDNRFVVAIAVPDDRRYVVRDFNHTPQVPWPQEQLDPVVADFNGDGRDDFLLTEGTGTTTRLFVRINEMTPPQPNQIWVPTGPPDQLVAVDALAWRDANGEEFAPEYAFSYSRLLPALISGIPHLGRAEANDLRYEAYGARSYDAAYPYAYALGPRSVVGEIRSFAQQEGGTAVHMKRIHYRNGIIDLEAGRRFVGFRDRLTQQYWEGAPIDLEADLELSLGGLGVRLGEVYTRELAELPVAGFRVGHPDIYQLPARTTIDFGIHECPGEGIRLWAEATNIGLQDHTSIDGVSATLLDYHASRYYDCVSNWTPLALGVTHPDPDSALTSFAPFRSHSTEINSREDYNLVAEVTNTAAGTSVHGSIELTEKTWYSHDPGAWHMGRVERRSVTEKRGVAGRTRTHEVELSPTPDIQYRVHRGVVGDPASYLRTDITEDQYGNIVHVEEFDADGKLLTQGSWQFDSRGEYVEAEIDAYQNTRYSWFEPRFGSLIADRSPNGSSGVAYFDAFGMPQLSVSSDGRWSRSWTETEIEMPSKEVRKNLFQLESDGAFRKIVRALGGGDIATYGSDGRGETLQLRIARDYAGRLMGRSRPVHLGTSVVDWDTFAYDRLGRLAHSVAADGSATAYRRKGAQVWTVNGRNYETYAIFNGRGELAQRGDALGNEYAYGYAPFGGLNSIQDPLGNSILAQNLDDYGRRRSVTDASSGVTNYYWDALGRLTRAEDSEGRVTEYCYDALSRKTHELRPSGWSYWHHDQGGGGPFLEYDWSSDGLERRYSYDGLGRQVGVAYEVDSAGVQESFVEVYSYDALGRQDSARFGYSDGLGDVDRSRQFVDFGFAYAPGGGVEEILDQRSSPKQSLWQWTESGPAGQHKAVALGNATSVAREFYATNGLPKDFKVLTPGTQTAVFSQGFTWDSNHNLRSLDDPGVSINETYSYDAVDRLSGQSSETINNSYKYSDNGNLTQTPYVSQFDYDAIQQPFSVEKADQKVFGYDATGFMTSRDGATVEYTTFGLPRAHTSVSGDVDRFSYGAGGRRFLKHNDQGDATLYLGGVLKRVSQGGSVVRHDFLLLAPDETGLLVRLPTTGTPKVLYLHLGPNRSLREVHDDTGVVVESRVYSPFGRMLSGNGEDYVVGFAGHEDEPDLGWVNMGGRVYDPSIGRFLTPDPQIGDLANPQSFNRYSYVRNNPLTFTDPSGFQDDGSASPTDPTSPEVPASVENRASEAAAQQATVKVHVANETLEISVLPLDDGTRVEIYDNVVYVNGAPYEYLGVVQDEDGPIHVYGEPLSHREAIERLHFFSTGSAEKNVLQSMSMAAADAGSMVMSYVANLAYVAQNLEAPPIDAGGRVEGLPGGKLGLVDPGKAGQAIYIAAAVYNTVTAAKQGFNAIKAGLKQVPGLLKRGRQRGRQLFQNLRSRLGLCSFTAGTMVATAAGPVPIEQIAVGDRVTTISGDSGSEVDGAWRRMKLELYAVTETGYEIYDIELLRPMVWLAVNGVEAVGDIVPLAVPEIGVSGLAVVQEVGGAAVEKGHGRAVLMVASHLDDDAYDLTFTEGWTLRATGWHPLFSVDRQAWVNVREIEPGERLETVEGAVEVAASVKVEGVFRVYNLEVEGDHEFLVGDAGVRAHNACSVFRDANGRLRNADGTFAFDGGRKRAASSGTHGNTAGDQPATLYERYDADDNFLKHGISQDPSKRYTKKELDGGYLVEIETGPRREILKLERAKVETNPGPLNKEPWAGSRRE